MSIHVLPTEPSPTTTHLISLSVLAISVYLHKLCTILIDHYNIGMLAKQMLLFLEHTHAVTILRTSV